MLHWHYYASVSASIVPAFRAERFLRPWIERCSNRDSEDVAAADAAVDADGVAATDADRLQLSEGDDDRIGQQVSVMLDVGFVSGYFCFVEVHEQ